MGRHMFAKAALIEAPPAAATPDGTDIVPRGLDEHLQTDSRRFGRSSHPRPALCAGCCRSITRPACRAAASTRRGRRPGTNESRQTETLGEAGIGRIRRAPGLCAVHRLHFRSLWTVDRLRHPDRATDLTTFVAAHRPMPFENWPSPSSRTARSRSARRPIVRYMQWAINMIAIWTGAIAIFGFVAALAMPVCRRPWRSQRLRR